MNTWTRLNILEVLFLFQVNNHALRQIVVRLQKPTVTSIHQSDIWKVPLKRNCATPMPKQVRKVQIHKLLESNCNVSSLALDKFAPVFSQ